MNCLCPCEVFPLTSLVSHEQPCSTQHTESPTSRSPAGQDSLAQVIRLRVPELALDRSWGQR